MSIFAKNHSRSLRKTAATAPATSLATTPAAVAMPPAAPKASSRRTAAQKSARVSATKRGFTMVEFMLATGFIAVLLVAIAIISSNMFALYQKGLTVKTIDNVGRALIDEFTAAINAAPSLNTSTLCGRVSSNNVSGCVSDRANKFVFQQRKMNYNFPSEGTYTVQSSGIFCTGGYSYLWNTYYGRSNDYANTIELRYRAIGGGEQTLSNFRLIRVKDPTHRVCTVTVDSNYNSSAFENSTGKYTINITNLQNGLANEIETPAEGFLRGSSLELDLYELTLYPISQDLVTLRTFMSGSFILATDRGNVNVISRANEYCDLNQYASDDDSGNPLDIGAEFNYCAINKFIFAARTAGK